MLIAPAIAARMLTRKLKSMFWLAALFGAFSGLSGAILSVEIALRWPGVYLPTGPAIVLVGSLLAGLALFFAPERGAFPRWVRRLRFRVRCVEENVLKELWKKEALPLPKKGFFKRLIFFRLAIQGWATYSQSHLILTPDGQTKSAAIVRLHRLWELYLTDQLGVQAEKVHASAEEIEHILTPELEERLTRLLGAPQIDPHQQPIPPKKAGL
jgi:manganese/zinc/iron transport system permease protein